MSVNFNLNGKSVSAQAGGIALMAPRSVQSIRAA
jgi:hypothetical protein